jgi:hypothetical protein
VAKSLVAMLLPSFHPLEISQADLLPRCVTLWKENAGAGRAFYTHACKLMPIEDVAKFMLSICNLLLITVAQHREKVGAKASDDTLQDSCLDEEKVGSMCSGSFSFALFHASGELAARRRGGRSDGTLASDRC